MTHSAANEPKQDCSRGNGVQGQGAAIWRAPEARRAPFGRVTSPRSSFGLSTFMLPTPRATVALPGLSRPVPAEKTIRAGVTVVTGGVSWTTARSNTPRDFGLYCGWARKEVALREATWDKGRVPRPTKASTREAPERQWAAVTTTVGETRVPPQRNLERAPVAGSRTEIWRGGHRGR